MRRSIFIVLVLAILTAALPAFGAEQVAKYEGRPVYTTGAKYKPEGFRDVKWGEDITKIPGMKERYTYKGNDQMIGYERASDKLMIGDVPLESITYVTFKGKLFSVEIKMERFSKDTPILEEQDEANRRIARLTEIMLEALGDIPVGHDSSGYYREYLWGFDGELLIRLAYDGCTLEYTYQPTLNEANEYEANVIKNAKNDL